MALNNLANQGAIASGYNVGYGTADSQEFPTTMLSFGDAPTITDGKLWWNVAKILAVRKRVALSDDTGACRAKSLGTHNAKFGDDECLCR